MLSTLEDKVGAGNNLIVNTHTSCLDHTVSVTGRGEALSFHDDVEDCGSWMKDCFCGRCAAEDVGKLSSRQAGQRSN